MHGIFVVHHERLLTNLMAQVQKASALAVHLLT
jgi:hypothetical protein